MLQYVVNDQVLLYLTVQISISLPLPVEMYYLLLIDSAWIPTRDILLPALWHKKEHQSIIFRSQRIDRRLSVPYISFWRLMYRYFSLRILYRSWYFPGLYKQFMFYLGQSMVYSFGFEPSGTGKCAWHILWSFHRGHSRPNKLQLHGKKIQTNFLRSCLGALCFKYLACAITFDNSSW